MGLSIDELLLSITESNVIKNFFNNPIYVALLITIIIMLVAYFAFKNNVKVTKESSLSFICLILVVGVYSFIAITAVEFLHIKVLKKSIKGKYENTTLEDTIKEITKGGSVDNQLLATNSTKNKETKLENTKKNTDIKAENVTQVFKSTPVISSDFASVDSSED